ncbi:MAG: hypothetical protein Q4P32_06155 [Micrococcales bacterium]|nr:hypothetical protein [Micrococcales bacterium]
MPQQARTELERLARRWQQLPLDRALARVADVRELAQRYARAAGEQRALPALGPATVLDQLTVAAYDLAVADPGAADRLAVDLATLRRRIG